MKSALTDKFRVSTQFFIATANYSVATILALLAFTLTASAPVMAANATLGLGVSAGLSTGANDEVNTVDKTVTTDDNNKPNVRRYAKHVSKQNKHGEKPEQSNPEASK